jgi:ribosomal-protein-alanine N-acetyltransferase
MRSNCHFTAVWEFHVASEKARAFEKVYGPEGNWAKLFRRGEGYIRTDLIRDHQIRGRYLTLDFWASRQAYQRFKKRNLASYKSLDKKCNSLTESERLIGEFDKSMSRSRIKARAREQVKSSSSARHVRPAMPTDIQGIIAIEQATASAAHWSTASYSEIFAKSAPARIALVSEHTAGTLLGFIVARITGEDCELENVFVASKVQRQGIGSELLETLRGAAQSQGAARLVLDVRESNSQARALYEKYRFKIAGRRKSYYSNPVEGALIYSLEL